MTGRPPMPFNQEAADEICGKIAEGQSLRRIMRDDTEGRLPGMTTIWKWLRENETFARQYAQSREEQAEAFADEIAAIADETPELEPVRGPDGEIVEMKMHAAYVQHQKNRIDARKWVASKLKPKKYGEKQMVEHTGTIETTTKEQRDAAVAAATRADR